MSDLFQRLTEPVTDQPTAIQPLRVSRFTLLSDEALTLPDGVTQLGRPPRAAQSGHRLAGPTLPTPLIAEDIAQSVTGALPSFRQIGRMAVGDGAPSAQPMRLAAAGLAHEEESTENAADLSVAEQPANQTSDPGQPAALSVEQRASPLAPATDETRATGSATSETQLPSAAQAAAVAHEPIASAPLTHWAPTGYRAAEMVPIEAAAPINKTHLDPVNDGAALVVPGESAKVALSYAELSTAKSAAHELAESTWWPEIASGTPQSTKLLPENPVAASANLEQTVQPLAIRPAQGDQAASPTFIGRPQSNGTQLEHPLATADPVHEPEHASQVQPASAGMSTVTPDLALANLGATAAPIPQQAPVGAMVQRKMAAQPDAAPLTPSVFPSNVQPITPAGQPQAGARSSMLEGFEPTPLSVIANVADDLGTGERATPSTPQPQHSWADRPTSPEQVGYAVPETSPLIQPALRGPAVVTPIRGETPSSQSENASAPLAPIPQIEQGAVTPFQEADLTAQVQPLVTEKISAGEPATVQAVTVNQLAESASNGFEQIQQKPTVAPLSPSLMPLGSTPDSSSVVGATPPAALVTHGPAGQGPAFATPVSQRQNEVTVTPLLEPEHTLPQRSQPDVRLNAGEAVPEPTKISASQTATNAPPTQTMPDLSGHLPTGQTNLGQVSGQVAFPEILTAAEPGLPTALGAEQAQVEPRLQPFTAMERSLFERAGGHEKEAEAVTATTEWAEETAKTPLAQPQALPPLASASTIQAPQSSKQASARQTPTLGQPGQPQADSEATILPKPQPRTPQGNESSSGDTPASALKSALLERAIKSHPIVEPAVSSAAGIAAENPSRAQGASPHLADQVNVSAPGVQPIQPSSPLAATHPVTGASSNPEGVVHPLVQTLPALVQTEAPPMTPSLGATEPLPSTPHQALAQSDSTVAPLPQALAQRDRMGTSEKQIVKPAEMTDHAAAVSPASNPRQDQPTAAIATLTAQLKPVTRLEQAAGAKETQTPAAYQQPRTDPDYRLRPPTARQASTFQTKVAQDEMLVAQTSGQQTETAQPAQSNGQITPVLRNVTVQPPTAKVMAAPLVEELAIAQPVRSSQGASRPVDRQLGVEPVANPVGAERRTADTATVHPHFEIFAPKRKPTTPPEPQPLPTIQVTIGRLIVQTTPELPKPTAPQRRTTQPPLSLDAYLQQRTREVL